jgi:hypothetical protein
LEQHRAGQFSVAFHQKQRSAGSRFSDCRRQSPAYLIEVKLTETQPSTALLKFQSALKIPAVQLTNRQGGFRLISNDDQRVLVAPAWQWFANLPQQ